MKAFQLTCCLPSRRNLHVIRTIEEYRELRHNMAVRRDKVGFVPTMGALHSGHIHLMKVSKKETDVSVASIFVNPTQFSAGEDLDKYPRTVERDIDLMKKSGAVDFAFIPKLEDIYGNSPLCHVEPSEFSHILEGKARPEFFRGVATIVAKLFNIIQPSVAYFGQKDISQCILIRRMVSDLNFPVKIRVIETVRESDGLAMSSRNTYLSPGERTAAPILYKSLLAGKKAIEAKGCVSREQVIEAVCEILRKEPLCSKVEYVSVASHEDMKELETPSMSKGAVLSSAIRVGNVRLIDNLLVGKAETDILA